VHAGDSEDTIISISRQLGDGGDWSWDHLFQVVDLIDVLSFIPEVVWAVYKY